MVIGRKERISLPIIWLLVVPGGMFLLYRLSPAITGNEWQSYAVLTAGAVITAMFPLNFKNISVSFQHWLLIAIFLKFGAGPEALTSQLIVVFSTLLTKSSMPLFHRFALNSLIFFTSSASAALVFFAAGGQIGSSSTAHILGMGMIYAVAYLIVNHLCLYADSLLTDRPYKLKSAETYWDVLSLPVVFPFGVAAYFLEQRFGVAGLTLVIIPFFITLAFTGKYKETNHVNRRLSAASETGYELAGHLGFDKIAETFIHRIRAAEGADSVYLIRASEGRLTPIRAFEEDQYTKTPQYFSFRGQPVHGGKSLPSKTRVYGTAKEWRKALPVRLPAGTESVVSVPLFGEDSLFGYLIIGSCRRHHFERRDAPIFELICTHLVVSLENANYVQAAISKSELCPLTGLYNYRWFDRELERRVGNVNGGVLSRLSLIILDIDHFKKLNDTFGHQSGNDILKNLARILEKETGEKGSVSRFGGEEFVILLPGYRKQEAADFAEHLRCYIERSMFEITPDLDGTRSKEFVSITVSIGVAAVPEDSDEPHDLLRSADRALYVGGKQAGRNRVGIYQA
ncbi:MULTISPECIES: sensor domain-containing diguanylate cyclase [Bhargavaea]|uniref:Sensor domain-containing diguanylate cyclase n=1 Tax=Bhargavaea changchunensis TaxID=2134037 RepID=A0ABW2NJ31_9BACL|nr:sensor domain-containing diguanylate cyclase [Bhargavaea sp. CC-171006]